jgi:hypothetical protein
MNLQCVFSTMMRLFFHTISAVWNECDITKLKPFLWFDVGWLSRFSKLIIYIHKFCILTVLM